MPVRRANETPVGHIDTLASSEVELAFANESLASNISPARTELSTRGISLAVCHLNNQGGAAVQQMIAKTLGVALLATGVSVVSAQSTQSSQGKAGQTTAGQATHDQHSSSVASSDEKFVKEAAMGGMAEVDLGMLASDKGSSDDVKSFGKRMVTDHGAANQELKSLASSKQIGLETSLDSKHKAMHDKFAKLSGSAFDRAYVADMLKDHQTDVAAFRREATSGRDPEIKAWAAKTLPTLEAHLQSVQELDKKVTTTRATK